MSDIDQALVALAERVEKLTGPDRQLDYAVMTATVPVGGAYMWDPNDGNHRYTETIEAALELVPEGYDWIICRANGGLTIHACVGDREIHFGETPALALTAAALRARARAGGEG